jgi:hypothetical protein
MVREPDGSLLDGSVFQRAKSESSTETLGMRLSAQQQRSAGGRSSWQRRALMAA